MTRRNTRRSLLALSAAAGLLFAACGDDSGESDSAATTAVTTEGAAPAPAACTEPTGEPINIVRNTWTASAVEAEIMKQLIETKLCTKAAIVDIDENQMFAGLSDGSLDLVTELWPSGVVAEEQALIDNGSIVNLGPLGAVGQIGWFVPDYVVAENPALATWEGLKDPAVAKTFATAETGDLGRFLGTDPSYSQVDEPLIANLELPFKVVFSGSEAATVAEIDSAVAAKKPIIMYWWTPTAAVGKYNLVEVKLPEHTAGCQDDIPATKCAYPADPLQKVASAKLQAKNAKVWAMFSKVQISNEMQLELLPQVEIDGKPAAEVAAAWIAANEAVWSAWVA